jgi:threonine/homoserine/homoserine lactone efflux protein
MSILSLAQAILYGSVISFAGTLPPGNINVWVMNVAATVNIRKALQFAIGVSVVEVIYLILTLLLLRGVTANPALTFWFRVITAVFLLILSLQALRSYSKNVKPIAAATPQKISTQNQFLTGVLLSAMNPLQILFWTGWIAWMVASGILKSNTSWYYLFSIGSGIGTLCALLLYTFVGFRMSGYFSKNGKNISLFMSAFFLLLALMQIRQLIIR